MLVPPRNDRTQSRTEASIGKENYSGTNQSYKPSYTSRVIQAEDLEKAAEKMREVTHYTDAMAFLSGIAVALSRTGALKMGFLLSATIHKIMSLSTKIMADKMQSKAKELNDKAKKEKSSGHKSNTIDRSSSNKEGKDINKGNTDNGRASEYNPGRADIISRTC